MNAEQREEMADMIVRDCLLLVGVRDADDRPLPPSMDVVIDLVDRYYTLTDGTAGALHAVLDDGKVEDKNVDFAIAYAVNAGDKAGEWLGRLLLLLSPDLRAEL